MIESCIRNVVGWCCDHDSGVSRWFSVQQTGHACAPSPKFPQARGFAVSPLQTVIDRMIDMVTEDGPVGTYCLLVGVAPATDAHWPDGKRVYRWCDVAQSRRIPNTMVVLAPSPSNDERFEYQGEIATGRITRTTLWPTSESSGRIALGAE